MHRVFLFASAVFFAAYSSAQSFCFLSASSYYEQVYCELQARGEARGLPPFYQFKRNDETIQASLLRRPAARIGIDLPAPRPASPVTRVVQPQLPVTRSQENVRQSAAPVDAGLTGCTLDDHRISCGDSRYQLMGNRLNHRLVEDALTDINRMELPRFSGDLQDESAVSQYLAQAYTRYIEKMHAIGLAGATLSYSKFVFLFYDVQDKGLDFSQRFETMYDFLKKDKARMGVSEALNLDPTLVAEDCAPVSPRFFVCQKAGRNFLFVAVE